MSRHHSRLPFHYGWVIVATGILTLFACLGLARFAFGMLLPAMSATLLLGYEQMGYISTGNFAGYLLAVALAPLLIRLLRPRRLIVIGLLLVAGGVLGMAYSHSFPALFLLYLLVGVGGGLANIPLMVLVSHWFRRERRGRAAGLMIMGSASGIVVSGHLIPHLNLLFGAQGWRVGWLVLGVIALTAALASALLIRNDPADLGLEPIGRKMPLPPTAVLVKESAGGGRILLELGALYLIFGITYMIYGTFIVTAMVTEYGFSEARAGFFWSWVGFFALFSGVLFGVLSDRIGRKRGLVLVFAIQSVAYLLAGSGLGSTALFVSIVLYGLSVFAIPTIMVAAVGDYLGLSRAAGAFSTITVFFAVGQTVGPGAAGLLAAATGAFSSSFLVAAALTAGAALLATLLPKPGA
jgi:MFS family permease